MMPAIRAVASASPLGRPPCRNRSATSVVVRSTPVATASRVEMALSDTSTMRASPEASTCVSVGNSGVGTPAMVAGAFDRSRPRCPAATTTWSRRRLSGVPRTLGDPDAAPAPVLMVRSASLAHAAAFPGHLAGSAPRTGAGAGVDGSLGKPRSRRRLSGAPRRLGRPGRGAGAGLMVRSASLAHAAALSGIPRRLGDPDAATAPVPMVRSASLAHAAAFPESPRRLGDPDAATAPVPMVRSASLAHAAPFPECLARSATRTRRRRRCRWFARQASLRRRVRFGCVGSSRGG